VIGEQALWTDDTHLAAEQADAMRYLAWMFATVHFERVSKQPPKPIPRPGDLVARPGEQATVNATERVTIVAASLSFEDMDRLVEAQTGRRPQPVGMGVPADGN
jgi:hypothetical protein